MAPPHDLAFVFAGLGARNIGTNAGSARHLDAAASHSRRPPDATLLRIAGARRNGEGEGFWEKLDRVTWELFQGRKEDIWQPDTRPEDTRYIPVDKAQSSLSFSDVYAKALLGADCHRDDAQQKVDLPVVTPLTLSVQTDPNVAALTQQLCEEGDDDACRVFTEGKVGNSDDTSWSQRVQQVADYSEVPEQQEERVLTGRQIAEYCFAKYGFYHDMVILQAKPFGNEKRQVAFNVYGAYLGDVRTFKMTEEQYIERLDRVADMLNAWDQAWYVRQFFRAKIAPRRGLPSRPQADTAVTLRLNTSPTWKYVSTEIVDPWFTY